MSVPRILIIAGSDSGGGAGIQADIKTVTMLGGHAMTAITAITAQNTLGVQAVHPVPTDIVLAQIESCISDIGVDAVKIGMIGSAETAHAVADLLSSSFPRRRESISQPSASMVDGERQVPIVLDPVMIATSGSTLADAATIAAFENLMAIATLVTPNVPELAVLADKTIDDEQAMENAAEIVMKRTGCPAVLAKGGHILLQGRTYGTATDGTVLDYDNADLVFDFLYQLSAEGWHEHQWFGPRIDTRHTHGTGCTLASAIAMGLGQGITLTDTVERARAYVRNALMLAPGLGSGHGPMGVPSGFAHA
jgi:hydroxymethylpyrimidine/phosphomethylpyrimidine kinase